MDLNTFTLGIDDDGMGVIAPNYFYPIDQPLVLLVQKTGDPIVISALAWTLADGKIPGTREGEPMVFGLGAMFDSEKKLFEPALLFQTRDGSWVKTVLPLFLWVTDWIRDLHDSYGTMMIFAGMTLHEYFTQQLHTREEESKREENEKKGRVYFLFASKTVGERAIAGFTAKYGYSKAMAYAIESATSIEFSFDSAEAQGDFQKFISENFPDQYSSCAWSQLKVAGLN